MLLSDIALGMLMMGVYIIIPGVLISYAFMKRAEFGHRLVFGLIFGVLQIGVIYFLLKNLGMVLNNVLILGVFILVCSIILINKDVRDRKFRLV